MNDDEIRRLEELVAGAAGAMAFPVLAEAHRRAGRPEEAERVARRGLEQAPQVTHGRVALALALLDQKRGDEAKRELERLLGGEAVHGTAEDTLAAEAVVFDGAAVADDELETAFEQAESDPEQMLGADDVAQAAMAAVPEEDDTDPGLVPAHEEPDGVALAADTEGPFATETVAGLLEQQGHDDEAGRLREALAVEEKEESEAQDASTPTPDEEPAEGGQEHRATLERWLDNLRRDRG